MFNILKGLTETKTGPMYVYIVKENSVEMLTFYTCPWTSKSGQENGHIVHRGSCIRARVLLN